MLRQHGKTPFCPFSGISSALDPAEIIGPLWWGEAYSRLYLSNRKIEQKDDTKNIRDYLQQLLWICRQSPGRNLPGVPNQSDKSRIIIKSFEFRVLADGDRFPRQQSVVHSLPEK